MILFAAEIRSDNSGSKHISDNTQCETMAPDNVRLPNLEAILLALLVALIGHRGYKE
jgi:hypothetical protein